MPVLSDDGLSTEEGPARGTIDGLSKFSQVPLTFGADKVIDRGTPRQGLSRLGCQDQGNTSQGQV